MLLTICKRAVTWTCFNYILVSIRLYDNHILSGGMPLYENKKVVGHYVFEFSTAIADFSNSYRFARLPYSSSRGLFLLA